jgi:hypothetical protein
VNRSAKDFEVNGYTTFKVYDNASDNSVKYYANEYMNGQKRYDYTMIEFVSDDRTIAACPAMILGFVQCNITLGIPTPQFTDEEELSLNTIQENMAVDNNLYVVVHTASDYVSSEQLETEFVSLFVLGDVMNCVYTVKVEAIHGPLFVFMVLLEEMLPNYSVPCHKGNGGNTLAARYNHKIILVDDTLTYFLTLKYYLTLLPSQEIFHNRTSLFGMFCCAPVLNILICL